MATSGSFSGSIISGKYKLRVDWSATQSVANNTSKITAVMYLVQASSWSLDINSRSNNTTVIAGTSHTWSSPAIDNSGGKTTKLATVTSGNIAHNADGTKSVTITATFYIDATISGTKYEKITASATVTLDTIPRATTPKLSASSANMGDSVTITLDRASSSFTHDLAYQFAGGSWVSIATGVGTSRAWTVPDLATSIPNASSGTMTIRCITKNGSTTVGTKTVSMTAKVPTSAAYQPTISAVTLTEATTGLATQFKAFIQNKSKVKAAITSAGAKGSTIKTVSTTFQGKTFTGSSWTSDLLTASGSLSMTTKVTDSRGRTASKTTTFSVLAYSTPRVTEFDAYRVNSSGAQDTEGEYALITYAYSVPSLNGGNTADLKIQYKASAEAGWANLLTGSALTADTTYTTGALFSSDNQYDLRIVVKDYFGAQSIYPATLPSGAVIMDILADGSGIGIGKVAELPGVCDIAMQTRLLGGQLHVVLPEGVNLNDCKTPGHYVGTQNVNYGNNPLGNSVTFDLEVVTAGLSGQTRQTITECKKDGARILHRFFYSGSWSEWSNTWYELPDDTNLNNLLEAGTYRLPSASTYTNAPEEGVGAMLEVMGSGTIIQRWTTASKVRPRTYERAYFSSEWGDWIKTYDAEVGKVYSASKSVQIGESDTGIDSNKDGASVSVPAGTYVITASAVFNTGASSGNRNNQIRILAGSTVLARQRVAAAVSWFGELTTSAIYTATATTTLKVQKSTTIAENSAGETTIKAVKIL